jgi:hypothetical protein
MGGVERGQRNVGVVNLYRIARALDMSLSELFAEVDSQECGTTLSDARAGALAFPYAPTTDAREGEFSEARRSR